MNNFFSLDLAVTPFFISSPVQWLLPIACPHRQPPTHTPKKERVWGWLKNKFVSTTLVFCLNKGTFENSHPGLWETTVPITLFRESVSNERPSNRWCNDLPLGLDRNQPRAQSSWCRKKNWDALKRNFWKCFLLMETHSFFNNCGLPTFFFSHIFHS